MTEEYQNIDVSEKTVMVIGAHPDDIEIIGGGALARAAATGGKGVVVVVTNGDKGSEFGDYTHEELVEIREKEQTIACKHLGCKDVEFLRYPDCYVQCDIHLKERLVFMVRKYKPDIVISHSPVYYSTEFGFINHNDHRATAEAVIDTFYPLSGNSMCFKEHIEQNLTTHTIKTLLISTLGRAEVNAFIDITGFLDAKIQALGLHASQLKGKEQTFGNMIAGWNQLAGQAVGVEAAEVFFALHNGISPDEVQKRIKKQKHLTNKDISR